MIVMLNQDYCITYNNNDYIIEKNKYYFDAKRIPNCELYELGTNLYCEGEEKYIKIIASEEMFTRHEYKLIKFDTYVPEILQLICQNLDDREMILLVMPPKILKIYYSRLVLLYGQKLKIYKKLDDNSFFYLITQN